MKVRRIVSEEEFDVLLVLVWMWMWMWMWFVCKICKERAMNGVQQHWGN